MVKRDPHNVLGLEAGATPVQIKAAWRKLARRHHPDLIGDDPAASRVATRQMAEINEAYARLTRADGEGGAAGSGAAGRHGRPGDGKAGESGDDGAATAGGGTRAARRGPPRPKATPPVTARLDTSRTVRPRNQSYREHAAERQAAGRRPVLPGQQPLRLAAEEREPPRASTPTGPLARSRIRDFRRPADPPLAEAADLELAFGKFHGHTLGQVAAFEPSYIDWLAATITRDPDLVAAARVVRDELDRRGVARRARPGPAATGGRRTG